jgi:hypothetical protein
MILSYFDSQIRPQLLNLINNAQIDIVAAVAWFTDTKIFNALQQAQTRGVKIQLLTQDDEINAKARFNLDDLALQGAKIWLWDTALLGTMHHKFMVVDSNTVMVGSYNWTYAAAKHNKENANIFSGSEAPINDYLDIFKEICLQANLNTVSPKNIITDVSISNVKAFLRIKILELEALISEQEEGKADIQGILERFVIRFRQRLGSLILKKMQLETEYARLVAEKSNKRSDQENYENLKDSQADNEKAFESAKGKTITTLSDADQINIKKMFREAIFAVHPDLFNDNPEKEAKATEITARLNDAYHNNDIDTVREIWLSILNGTAFSFKLSDINDLEKLEELVTKLESKYNQLIEEIKALKTDGYYQIAINSAGWEDYFVDMETKLEVNIDLLNKQIMKLK